MSKKIIIGIIFSNVLCLLSIAQEAIFEYNNNVKHLFNPANVGRIYSKNHAGISAKYITGDSMPSYATLLSGGIGGRSFATAVDVRATEGVQNLNYGFTAYGKSEMRFSYKSKLHAGVKFGCNEQEIWNNEQETYSDWNIVTGGGIVYEQLLSPFGSELYERISGGFSMHTVVPVGENKNSHSNPPLSYTMHLQYLYNRKEDRYYLLYAMYQDLDLWFYNPEEMGQVLVDHKELLISAIKINPMFSYGLAYKHRINKSPACIASLGYKLNKKNYGVRSAISYQLGVQKDNETFRVLNQLSVSFYFADALFYRLSGIMAFPPDFFPKF